MAKNLPPTYDKIAKHEVFPETTSDEKARYNFLASLNKHLAHVSQGNKIAYENRVKPKFEKEKGRTFQSKNEVDDAMSDDPHYQIWSAMRRSTMEMRQQAGRSLTYRQGLKLKEKVEKLNAQKPNSLILNDDVKVPPYLLAVDNHLMPGSYHTELFEGDVSNAANYDGGLFVTTAGLLGKYSDGGGKAMADWMTTTYPDFQPKRILDIGCGMGHNVIPIARRYPDAEIIAIDTGRPMLKYGHARMVALGIENVTFMQAEASNLPFEAESFDWIQTTMFLHETGGKSIYNIMKEVYRTLKKDGITMHIEQPQYTDDMSFYEQWIRDWDAYNNSEPYWSKMHDIDPKDLMEDCGFDRNEYMQIGAKAINDLDDGTQKADEPEDHGRSPIWNVFGAWKR